MPRASTRPGRDVANLDRYDEYESESQISCLDLNLGLVPHSSFETSASARLFCSNRTPPALRPWMKPIAWEPGSAVATATGSRVLGSKGGLEPGASSSSFVGMRIASGQGIRAKRCLGESHIPSCVLAEMARDGRGNHQRRSWTSDLCSDGAVAWLRVRLLLSSRRPMASRGSDKLPLPSGLIGCPLSGRVRPLRYSSPGWAFRLP